MILVAFGPTALTRAYDADGDGVDDHYDVCCDTPQGAAVDTQGRPIGDLDRDCDVDLLDYAMLQAAFTGDLPACQVCATGNDCAGDEYCAKLLGACQDDGTCNPRPNDCLDMPAPVCGCDGITYTNACFAALAGVSVGHEGSCLPPGCQANAECDAADFCAKAVGNCDGFGQCVTRPLVCVPGWDPVCGCDGITYLTPCYAAQAGASVDNEGPCLPDSCQANKDCGGWGYCAKAIGDCEGTGQCQTPPIICMPDWDPVCACDGVTYDNPCLAAHAGESIDYAGECIPAGCQSSADCNESEYCAKEVGDCDGTGHCEPRPGGCIPSGETVCGCDGETYEDVCYAALAGVSVAHDGPCPG